MSLDVEVSSGVARVPVSRDAVARAARQVLEGEGVTNALVSIAFVSNARIAVLNRRHLGRRGSTDVIAFGLSGVAASDLVIGDIYIALEVARVNAKAHGVGIREEVVRLVVHGTLHVTGADHPDDDSRVRSPMWMKQEKLVGRLMRRAPP